MAVTASSRSQTVLVASTTLPPSEAIDAVRKATDLVGERGVGKVEGKWQKGSNQVLIDEDGDTVLMLKVALDQSQRGNLSFPARAEDVDGGGTRLQVGGLADYQVIQSKLLGLIPMGPGSIVHFGFYKKFLERVSQELLAIDPKAQVSIGVDEE